ncbi:LysR family transcriptional regulator [Tsukamurella pseudospumae]|uniref:HTH lysR-type domain-containing protein n=1 Tax=Tsukamurella pseudospumae TaxID=239498 RepID=A0A138AVU3_9ACTN|nr:LysR family transcriptional regulator [Tsukamurella pseudospumae]KXO89534.1 hypothetical protein AXK61_08845 [Tsukamurella pseudospumae]KXP14587.1 hypothetical protein AXK60_01415 [Tsukamurella pseudospumae]
MSDIERLRLVATVARTASMNVAAQVHGTSQPSVTRAVAGMEKLLGFALFERGSAGTTPAPGALPALAVIERVVAGLDELRELGCSSRSTISVCRTLNVYLPDYIEGRITRWNRAHEVQVEQCIVDDPVAALRSGECDLAVVHLTGPMLEGVETQVVRALGRAGRVELLNRPAPSGRVAAFLKYLG